MSSTELGVAEDKQATQSTLNSVCSLFPLTSHSPPGFFTAVSAIFLMLRVFQSFQARRVAAGTYANTGGTLPSGSRVSSVSTACGSPTTGNSCEYLSKILPWI